MDHSPYSKTSYGQAAEGQQKNAYARLVQQHHSGRFKLYLNYIAQKLQEECVHGDPVHAKDSAFVAAVKDGQGRNGLSSQSSIPEKGSEPANANHDRMAAVQKHQYGKDIDRDLVVGERYNTHSPQNSSNLPLLKGSHNHECKEEPRHDQEASKSKGISREQHFEGMVSVKGFLFCVYC